MALSRRDVIITCLVAFVAWAWLTHWLPQLRFLPYAFAAGALSVLFSGVYLLLFTVRAKHDASPPPLPRSSFVNLASPDSWQSEILALEQRSRYQPLKIKLEPPLVTERINELVNLALRDFVRSWFSKISNGSAFSNEIDRALRASLETVIERFLALDLVDFAVTRLLPILNSHIRDFHEAERLVRGRTLNVDVTETSELNVAIAARYRNGKLHPAASLAASRTTASQQQHLRRVASLLVSEVLPSNMRSSSSVLILIREILACAVLLPVMVLLADPDVLNQLIEIYGRSIWQERKTIRKLRAALDEASSSPQKQTTKAVALPKLNQHDSERSFEKFVRAIRQCSSLPDARRFRSEIARQLKRDSAKPDRDLTYIRRLEMGRKLLDQKVAELSLSQNPHTHERKRTSLDGQISGGASWRESASLRQILYDASALSYFMEFMDRLDRMSLVQFWIVVDGLRSPLDPDVDQSRDSAKTSGYWDQSDRQDLAQISSVYLSKPELKVPQASKDAVSLFLDAGDQATSQQYNHARQVVLDIQASVFQEMKDRHFPNFRKSDLFYKWLASESTTTTAVNNSTSSLRPVHQNLQKETLKIPTQQLKEPGLRRAIASSSDLTLAAKAAEQPSEPRRSLDDISLRPPLFDDEPDEDPLSRSTQSLGSNDVTTPPQHTGDRDSMIDAVQAALDDLVDVNGEEDSLTHSWPGPDSMDNHGDLFDDSHSGVPIPVNEKGKPSLSSLGLLGTPSRPTVFSQGDLFGENEMLWEEENEEENTAKQHEDDEDIHEAAPGDLGLSELVQSMTLDIEKLEAQQSIVESLTRKAELTNNAAELRILRKSKTSLEREIHRKELQRQQYIIQRSENDLYGKASVAIKSIMVGTDLEGHEFAMYVIEVQRNSGETTGPVTWAIARRYSEFHDLNRRLRSKFPEVRDLDFPRRQMVVTLQRDFLKKRRVALEKYLRELLARPTVCRSIEFRAFLSQQAIRPISDGSGNQIDRQDFITRIYNSVTDGMEEFLGNIPVLDQLSAAGQNLITAATSTSLPTYTGHTPTPSTIADNPAEAAEAEAEIKAFETTTTNAARSNDAAAAITTSPAPPETIPFIKPICDIFVEIFQLNQGNNWLRGRAVVLVIQQLLGGTIERRVRDTFKALTSPDAVARYLALLRDTMWPGGSLRAAPLPRAEPEKARSRREAGLVLATLLPELAGGVVGRGNAAKAGRRVFAAFNNERLNEHLLYTLLDEIVDGVFGVRVGK